jgi:signal transduction histidine kinase
VEALFRRIVSLAGVIESGATRTARIIGDLKTFSHPGRERFEEFDLHEHLDVCLNLIASQVKERIEFHKDYGSVERMFGPAGQLNQVFMNILSNAHQAIPGRGEIHVTTRQVDGWVTVRIKDTGTGIPPDVKSRIFDPFFTTKDPGVGTGLGLSLSYGIISQLGGAIECESQVGQGTEFIVRIPSRAESAAALETLKQDPGANALMSLGA